MQDFTKKYGEKGKFFIVAISFTFLLVELTYLWTPDQDARRKSTVLKNKTAKTSKLLNLVVENGRPKNGNELKPVTPPSTKVEENKLKKEDKLSKVEDVDTVIQKLLSPFVNGSLGRVLNIEFKTVKQTEGNESKDTLDIVYRKAWHGVKVLDKKLTTVSPLGRRFVYVYERYWEQLTMNTRVLMALASQARIGGRFVVEPKVKDSVFGETGYPFSTYYNVSQVNTLLKSNGYSTLVTRDVYETECSISENSHAILHFLYKDDKAVSFLKKRFSITNQEYLDIEKRATKNGWTECDILKPYLEHDSKVFCVDPAVITEWDVLEHGILRDVKCLGIFVWRGIGVKIRTSFSEKYVKISSSEIHFLLKPSLPILNQADKFTKSHLSGDYIAVQVRAEKVILQHGLTRLKKCLRLLVNAVIDTKASFGMTTVFLASDMGGFGSGSWDGSLKNRLIDAYALKPIQSSLISQIGAVGYKPSADWQTPDRGAVSLVELSIIAHAQHLLTIGTGSFQGWAVGKFLEFHRDDDPKLWSLTRMCSLP